jgi:hypothetical protein
MPFCDGGGCAEFGSAPSASSWGARWGVSKSVLLDVDDAPSGVLAADGARSAVSDETRSSSGYIYGIDISEGKSGLGNSYSEGRGGGVPVDSSSRAGLEGARKMVSISYYFYYVLLISTKALRRL